MFLNLAQKNIDELTYWGYTSIGHLPPKKLADLKDKSLALVQKTKKDFPDKELFNLINSDKATKDKSRALVDSYFVPTLHEIFDDAIVDIFAVSHIVKPFGLKSRIWHQDSSVVDETKHFSFNAWTALVDSHLLNGNLWILPGSHINTNHYRQFGFNPIEGKFLKELKPYMKRVPSKAGEIILFHRNLIHGSSNNLLPIDRIAVEALVTSKDAQLYNYHRDENLAKDKIMCFKVDERHYFKENPKEDFYNGEVDYDLLPDISKEEMIVKLRQEIPLYLQHANKINH